MLHIQTNCAAKGIISVHCRRPVKQSSLCFYSLPPLSIHAKSSSASIYSQPPGQGALSQFAFFFFLSGRFWPRCSAALRLLRESVTHYWLKVKTPLQNYCQNIKHTFLNSKGTKQGAPLRDRRDFFGFRLSQYLWPQTINKQSDTCL